MKMAESLTVSQYLQIFRRFSREEKLKIAKKINQLTFQEQWAALDAQLPDIDISDDEIMQEVKAVRYGKEN